jgi:SAM-dependent methyltransferase
MEDLRESLPSEIYDYVIGNNLIYYDQDDADKEYPTFDRDKLPEEYIRTLIKLDPFISYRDLHIYKIDIVSILKRLNPGVKEIYYTSVDPLSLSPRIYGDDNIWNIISQGDKLIEDKVGVKLNFIDHYTETFQKYIEHSKETFDVVWFMRCTDFSLAVDPTLDYIRNFRKILKRGGIIVHMDWNGKGRQPDEHGIMQPAATMINIMDRYRLLPTHENEDKVNFLMKYIREIQKGIYMFTEDFKRIALNLLL